MDTRRTEHLAGCELTWTDNWIAVSGEVDQSNAGTIANRLSSAITGTVTAVDLRGVTFFSAAGVRLVMTIADAARAADVIVHVTCSPIAWHILDLCGATELPGLVLHRSGGQQEPERGFN